MPDIWMDVDAAVTVPCNILPLVASSDGKTIADNTIAYNETGLEVYWNFVTTAGAQTCTPITPTTSGDYDWTHVDGGMYKIEIPASGGASANNDTEGFGWITGACPGGTPEVLPFRGPTIGFRAAALNNALVDGTTIDVNVTGISDAMQLRLGIVTYGTAQAADATSIQLASASAFADDELNGAVVVITGGTGVGQSRVITDYVGSTDTATVDTWTTTPSGTITYVVFAAAPASATSLPGVNVIQAAGTAWGSGAITAASLAADAGAEIADAVLNRDMSTGTDSGSATIRTVRQALRFLRNKWSISEGTLTVTKEDDTTASWTAELSTTEGADPVTGSDPASS